MASLAEMALQRTNDLYQALDLRRPDIERADEFYRGEQPLAYASQEWTKAHADLYRDFSDNWCGVVGNSPVERLAVSGFRVGDDTDVFSADEKDLWNDWIASQLDAQSSQGFLQSIIAKRSHVQVWGNNDDEPDCTWEHPAQSIVGYDPANNRRRVDQLKTWVDGNTEYATYADSNWVWKWQRPYISVRLDSDGRTLSGLYVEQWARGVGGWVQRENLPKGEPWPMKNPFGEPFMVEFPNRPMLGGEPISDIAGTMAMQNTINMLWAYLFNAADYASMPARVVLGMEPPKVPVLDSNGQVIGTRPAKMEDVAQKRLMFLPGTADEQARIDQWEAARLDVFTAVIEQAVGHIAAQTRTPPHYLVTNKGLSNLSGDALVAAETGLVKKVEESQLFYTAPVRTVFRLMAKVRKNDKLADACSAGVIQWKDAETRSAAQMADAAAKDASIGLPLAFILERRYGLSQTEIQRVLDMKRDEMALWQPPAMERLTVTAAQAGPPGTGSAANLSATQAPSPA